MNDALEKFLQSAPADLKLIWKTLEQYDLYCFGGFWRHQCDIDYLYNDGDIDVFADIPIYKLKLEFIKNLVGINFHVLEILFIIPINFIIPLVLI